MVFDSIELFLLASSERIRYAALIIFLGTLLTVWWVFGMSTTLQALRRLKQAEFERGRCQQQALDAQCAVDKIAFENKSRRLEADKRLSSAGGYKFFLKRCGAYELDCQETQVMYSSREEAHCTMITATYTGTFEQFYDFLSNLPLSFIVVWKKCFCKLAHEGHLEIQSDIALYTK